MRTVSYLVLILFLVISCKSNPPKQNTEPATENEEIKTTVSDKESLQESTEETKSVGELQWPEGIEDSPVRNACYEGDIGSFNRLVDEGEVPDGPCLLLACYKGHTDLAERILEFGVDPNFRPGEKVKFGPVPDPTPLMVAALGHSSAGVLDLLIDHGAWTWIFVRGEIWEEGMHHSLWDPDAIAVAEEFSDYGDVLNYDKLIIIGNQIWVRDNPTDGKVVMKLDEGTECRILEKGKYEVIRGIPDYWYNIRYRGQEGWIFGSQTTQRQLVGKTGRELLEKVMIKEAGWPVFNLSMMDNSGGNVGFPIGEKGFDLNNPVSLTVPSYDGDPWGISGQVSYEDDNIVILSFLDGQAHGGMSCNTSTLYCFRSDEVYIVPMLPEDKRVLRQPHGAVHDFLDIDNDGDTDFILHGGYSHAGAEYREWYVAAMVDYNSKSVEIADIYDTGDLSTALVESHKLEVTSDKGPEFPVIIINEELIGDEEYLERKTGTIEKKLIWDKAASTLKEVT